MSYDCVYAYQIFFSLPAVGIRNGCADSINLLIPHAQQSKKSKKESFASHTQPNRATAGTSQQRNSMTKLLHTEILRKRRTVRATRKNRASHLKIKKKERKKEKTEKRTNGKNSWFVLPSCATDKVDGTANADIECSLRKHIPKWVKEPASPTHTNTIFFPFKFGSVSVVPGRIGNTMRVLFGLCCRNETITFTRYSNSIYVERQTEKKHHTEAQRYFPNYRITSSQERLRNSPKQNWKSKKNITVATVLVCLHLPHTYTWSCSCSIPIPIQLLTYTMPAIIWSGLCKVDTNADTHSNTYTHKHNPPTSAA